MKIAQLFILILAFFMISPAKAALLIEPVVGFNAATKYDFKDGENYSGGMGLGYGGRLGYQNLGFQLGLDFLKSSIDMDDNDFKKNVDTTDWAAFVGFKFPILLKVYAGYIFSSEGESKNAAGKVKFQDGTGVKIGIGTTLLPFLDVNLDYRRGTYDKVKAAGLADSEADFSAYMLSISLPFTL